MPLLVISKFDEDPIKTEGSINRTTFSNDKSGKMFRHSRASKSKVNIPIWSKFELRRECMPILVNCKFDEDQN